MSDKIELIEIDYHRNGVGGAGFWAFRFNWYLDGADEPTRFVGMHFPDGEVTTGVLREDLSMPTVKFGLNSWRGDYVHPHVLKWIAALTKIQDDYEVEHGYTWYNTTYAERMALLQLELMANA